MLRNYNALPNLHHRLLTQGNSCAGFYLCMIYYSGVDLHIHLVAPKVILAQGYSHQIRLFLHQVTLVPGFIFACNSTAQGYSTQAFISALFVLAIIA